MKVLFCGDVVGKSGRRIVLENVPSLRKRLDLDFVIVNGENAAHGFGISERMCTAFYNCGVDVLTTGNHVWDHRPIMNYIGGDPRLIRPLNYPEGTPGNGSGIFETRTGATILVAQPMGRLFMNPLDDPFSGVEKALAGHRLGDTINCIFIDMHAEATSEKMAMGHFLDGRVSMVAGSHSHVPTADTQILPGGTAYQTDTGMCGDYNSVIGMTVPPAVARFTEQVPTDRLAPAEGPGTLCAVYLETDDQTGLARHVAPLQMGGRLREMWPV
jgi:2',3'-cyclic-nucleotide 2'-phosphodiesterase